MWKNGPPTATVGRPFLESPCEARSEFQDDPPLAHIESTKPEVESLVPGKELVVLRINSEKSTANVRSRLPCHLDSRCDKIGTQPSTLKMSGDTEPSQEVPANDAVGCRSNAKRSKYRWSQGDR